MAKFQNIKVIKKNEINYCEQLFYLNHELSNDSAHDNEGPHSQLLNECRPS